jgi:hypothetical protein
MVELVTPKDRSLGDQQNNGDWRLMKNVRGKYVVHVMVICEEVMRSTLLIFSLTAGKLFSQK